MKQPLRILILLAIVFSAGSVKAQLLGNNERYSQYVSHVNVGLESFFNINPGSGTYKPGFGVSLKYQYDVTQNLGVTIGTGYSVVNSDRTLVYKSDPNYPADLKILPIKLGAKAYFLPEFYIGGEVGVSFVTPYIDPKSQSHFSKTIAPSLGYETNHIDLSFRYENINHQNAYVSFIALRAAYLFNF